MITVSHLSFSYGQESILKNIDLQAEPSSITALIGPNGVGKSTLMRCLAGLEKYSGDIFYGEKNILTIPEREKAKTMGYLGQNVSCFAELTVFEVVLSGLLGQLTFRVTDEDTQKAEQIIKKLNIESLSSRKIFELSGGQQQLVFIAQTLVKDPEILILDEPTSALDMQHQFSLMETLSEYTISRNITTVMSLHHLNLVSQFADRVIILKNGSVFSQLPPEQALTEEMFHNVYGIAAEFYRDSFGTRHVIPTRKI